jgi:hypothetical protein
MDSKDPTVSKQVTAGKRQHPNIRTLTIYATKKQKDKL